MCIRDSVYSDDDAEETDIDPNKNRTDEKNEHERCFPKSPKVNDYVLVKFEGKNKNFYYYIGNILKKIQDEFLVKFMEKSGKKFVWQKMKIHHQLS